MKNIIYISNNKKKIKKKERMFYMNGFESKYFRNFEAETERREGERSIECNLDSSSQAAKSDEIINIEEATMSSLKILSKLMEYGEDVGDAVKVAIEGRVEVIKKLMQEGRLNNICDDLKNRINEYLNAEINKEKDEGR